MSAEALRSIARRALDVAHSIEGYETPDLRDELALELIAELAEVVGRILAENDERPPL